MPIAAAVTRPERIGEQSPARRYDAQTRHGPLKPCTTHSKRLPAFAMSLVNTAA